MTVSSLVWIRRDMRLHDHAALATALAQDGDIQPVFVFDTEVLERFPAKDDRRLTFLAETLCQMHAELKKRGGGLLVLHGRAETIIPALAEALHAQRVVAARDFEPNTHARDEAVADAMEPQIRFLRVTDHLIRSPQDVLKKDETPYKVFTPYSKIWKSQLRADDYAPYEIKDKGRYAELPTMRRMATMAGLDVLKPEEGAAALLKAIGYEKSDITGWAPEDAAMRLKNFTAKNLAHYSDTRDTMGDIHSTSRLSPYLRFGLVSIRECVAATQSQKNDGVWLNELIWREFYAMILWHFPETPTLEFQPKYQHILPWSQSTKAIEAWKAGKTGFPVVDAAMRQLLAEGWMHNRARMIVASFLTKHLRVDWRVGEEHFAQYLMDYELASNVGGWQWASSTGTDAQPYFRVFNPTAQGEKFDAKGEYIRRFLPELRDMPSKHIHEPWKAGKEKLPALDYPKPIVDHPEARQAAIEMFRKLRQ